MVNGSHLKKFKNHWSILFLLSCNLQLFCENELNTIIINQFNRYLRSFMSSAFFNIQIEMFDMSPRNDNMKSLT